MGKNQRGGGMSDVKSNFRRKLDERAKQKSGGKGEAKKAKPQKITCLFDPSEYVSTKPEMKDFRGVRGDQPDWVIEKYGKNCQYDIH